MNARSRCALGSASLLPPPRLSSLPRLPWRRFRQSRAVCKWPHGLGVFTVFPTPRSWLESCAWVRSAAARVRFEGSSRSHWWVADVDTFTFTLCLSVCPLCYTLFDSLQHPRLCAWTQARLWHSSHHRHHFPRHCAVAHNAWELIDCRFGRPSAYTNDLIISQMSGRAGGSTSFFFLWCFFMCMSRIHSFGCGCSAKEHFVKWMNAWSITWMLRINQ